MEETEGDEAHQKSWSGPALPSRRKTPAAMGVMGMLPCLVSKQMAKAEQRPTPPLPPNVSSHFPSNTDHLFGASFCSVARICSESTLRSSGSSQILGHLFGKASQELSRLPHPQRHPWHHWHRATQLSRLSESMCGALLACWLTVNHGTPTHPCFEPKADRRKGSSKDLTGQLGCLLGFSGCRGLFLLVGISRHDQQARDFGS